MLKFHIATHLEDREGCRRVQILMLQLFPEGHPCCNFSQNKRLAGLHSADRGSKRSRAPVVELETGIEKKRDLLRRAPIHKRPTLFHVEREIELLELDDEAVSIGKKALVADVSAVDDKVMGAAPTLSQVVGSFREFLSGLLPDVDAASAGAEAVRLAPIRAHFTNVSRRALLQCAM